jgi:hypothetical protein
MKMNSHFRGNDEEKKGGSAGAALFWNLRFSAPMMLVCLPERRFVMMAIVLLLVQATTAADFGDHLTDLARQHCEREWPDNFEMQEYCLGQQRDGINQYIDVRDSMGVRLKAALRRCVDEWAPPGDANFEMVGYCAKQQADAYHRLHPGD